MEKNFGEVHRKEVGEDIAMSDFGYPDNGSGRYSDKLSYKGWFELNCAQRAHYNFVEQIGLVIPMTLIAGIATPLVTTGLACTYAVGRFMYANGYMKKGPNGRECGSIIANLSLIGL